MTFEHVAQKYLQAFQQAVQDAQGAGVSSTEMATRPIAHSFIDELVHSLSPADAEIVVHHDTHVGGSRNTPDWRVEDRDTFGVYIYGDHKNLSSSGPFTLGTKEREQMLRYLEMGRPLFVFDGVEFIFYSPDKDAPLDNHKRLSLIPKPLDFSANWSAEQIQPLIEQQFQDLLGAPGFRKWSEPALMEQLASRATLIAESIRRLLDSPAGGGTNLAENKLIDALHELNELVANHHDPSLSDPRTCSEFVAQVLVFGLFFAHTRSPEQGSTPEARREAIRTFWSGSASMGEAERLKPFHTIAELLAESLDSDTDLASWYRDITGLLAHAEYMGTEAGPSDFHTLFERFLSKFSNELRYDRGAFYTPKPLAGWMARFADELCIEKFGDHLGVVADKVIDPCCGTGGLVEAVIQTAPVSSNPPDYIGFEVLPAPYALAHYRLTDIAAGTSAANSIQLFLTDTLSDFLDTPPEVDDPSGFSEQVVEASQCASPPLRVVIGNPPSSARVASGAPRNTIHGLMADFRPPQSQRSSRQNVQQAISNEAYRFLRWCAGRVLNSDRGLLILALPGAFTTSVSLKYAREWLLKSFQELWILDLDADARIGSTTQSLFQVMQGRCILFAVHDSLAATSAQTASQLPAKPVPAEVELIRYLDVRAMSRVQKQNFLDASAATLDFEHLTVSKPDWRFGNVNDFPSDKTWQASWPLKATLEHQGIFRLKCSGIKLAPSSVLYHTEEPILVRRAKDISSGTKWASLRIDWFKGQRRPPAEAKFTQQVRNELGRAASTQDQSIVPYSFRPFVDGAAIDDDGVFSAIREAPGDGPRNRPEIRAAYRDGAVGIAVAPAPADLGDTMSRFVSFAHNLPDNDLSARGNAMIYPDRAPEELKRKDWDPTVKSNVTPPVSTFFEFDGNPSRACLYYCYAVLNSGVYLSTFEPVLYAAANPDAPPRVPIAADAEDRKAIVELGLQAAALEKPSTVVPLIDGLVISWPEAIDEFRLKRGAISEDGTSIDLDGDQGEQAKLAGLPAEVSALRIAGHDVVAKWIRERTFPYLRRTFTRQDAEALQMLVARISRQMELLSQVDTIVDRILTSGDLIVPTSTSQ